MTAEETGLTQEEFNELVKDLPEDAFRTLIPVLMESFEKQRGRTLDTTQVAALVQGLMEMGAVIDTQVMEIDQLKEELKECQENKRKLWKPGQ